MITDDRIEKIRDAFDGGLPLLHLEDRRLRRTVAEACLDSLSLDYTALIVALHQCCDEADYCYVCDQHPSSGHKPECPVGKALP